ncbi:hypothetical protein DW322_00665 [Rhodococcus rhodnii]|uniref:Uncharacterized protein n=2 Tax=Rhodococcus rhodnii TaxID=38312 RepID=R7WQZ5_9NOCA|nr:hypothetical protein [Rhodococcus rhodnii]EOM77738.1 hypothetical protein Rrhod_0890 [Rhodococcus rhodnii LMG 5362]TXG89019.1 hypothetical protein DW322_00665 [Rhodococcus rhodnii]
MTDALEDGLVALSMLTQRGARIVTISSGLAIRVDYELDRAVVAVPLGELGDVSCRWRLTLLCDAHDGGPGKVLADVTDDWLVDAFEKAFAEVSGSPEWHV